MFVNVLTFAGGRGSCLNTRPLGRVFKHLPRDPNETNKWDRYILHILPDYNKRSTENTVKNLQYHFLAMGFSKQNGVSVKLSNIITSSQRHNLTGPSL